MTFRLTLIAALALALAAPLPALAKTPKHPTGLKQPLKDGCQRADVPLGLGVSPEWVYVYKDPTIRSASGVVVVSHNSLDDAIIQHEWYDYNGNLVVGKQFKYLIAGSSSSHTNNFADAGEEFGRLHFEWEQGSLPFFAWPTDGDHATIWGSWIWDCGHWSNTENNQPGSKTTGEHSELHPLNAIAINRKAPYSPTKSESETDVYISNDGTIAHAVEQCAKTHKPAKKSPPQYDSGFKPCTQKTANKKQPLAKSYSFFVPAPQKPSKNAKLSFRVVNQVHSAGTQSIKVKSNGLAVTVKTKSKYGKSFFVSWKGDKAKPTPLKVTLKSLTIVHADPNPSSPQDQTPPTWDLYLNVNGYWQLLNNWAPALSGVTDGQVIALDKTIDVNVPKGSGVWLQVGGRECDEPADTTVFNTYARIVKPCGANRDEINSNPLLLLSNDYPGLILDNYATPANAIGDHVSKSQITVKWPNVGTIGFGHFGDGDDDYELSYSIAAG